jgi:hypothetical protein
MGYAIDDFQRRCLAVILRKVPPPLPPVLTGHVSSLLPY